MYEYFNSAAKSRLSARGLLPTKFGTCGTHTAGKSVSDGRFDKIGCEKGERDCLLIFYVLQSKGRILPAFPNESGERMSRRADSTH